MIRCSHCGKLAPSGALSCQHCGMPLVSGVNGGAGAGQSEREDLPAWLESLRAHERPVSNNQENRQPFSLDELVDEDSMPSWMRQDRRKISEGGTSDSLPVLPAMSAGADKQNTPTAGFQAGSLIDERSLPAWMRENQDQAGAQPGTAPNVSAHSLVDQQGLPAWIKDLSQAVPAQQAPQTPPRNASGGLPAALPQTPTALPGAARTPQTPPARDPAAAFTQGFSAHDLVDAQAMPAWMSGSQGPGQGPGAPPTRPVPTGQGFSAGELVDQRSVPQWMKELQGGEQTNSQSAMGVPVNGWGQTTGTQGMMSHEGRPARSLQEQNSAPAWLQESQLGRAQQAPDGQGFSASSLLDAGAAPAWMREGLQSAAFEAPSTGQGMSAGSLLDAGAAPAWMKEGLQGAAPNTPPNGQGFSAGSLLDMSAMPAWMKEGQQGGAQSGQGADQGMAAGSLIDMNAMPAWLRNSDTAQSGAGGRPGQVPARPVPSRPRNEGMPQEQSEAAANVFASMLGVAASAPALPGQDYAQGTNLGVAQGAAALPPMPPLQQAQPGIPGWQQPGQNQYNQGAQARMWQMSGPMPAIQPQNTPDAYAPGGQPAWDNAASARPQNADQPAWMGYSATDRTALGVTSGVEAGYQRPDGRPGNAQNTDTKKKGFFDSIRDFFTR